MERLTDLQNLLDPALGLDPQNLTLFDSAVLFTADDGQGLGLWRFDDAGLVRLADVEPPEAQEGKIEKKGELLKGSMSLARPIFIKRNAREFQRRKNNGR